MNTVKQIIALLLVIVLAGFTFVNTTQNVPVLAMEPATISQCVAVSKMFRSMYRRCRIGLRKYAMSIRLMDIGLRTMLLFWLAVMVYGGGDQSVLLAAPLFQKWTAGVESWTHVDDQSGLKRGLSYTFMPPNQAPPKDVLRKIQWGEWAKREMYEQAETDYFILLCVDSKEVLSVLNEMKNGLPAPDGHVWWPCWSTFGDKGNHIVFIKDKQYPSWWLERLHFKAVLNGKGSDFWKFMKRFRRTTAHPEVFGKMRVIDIPVRNWMGRKGWTLYTMINTGLENPQEFTVLVRPMIRNADGQSFCTRQGVKKAWNLNTRPLDLFSLGGVCDMGTIKGHCLVVTPGKELPADFVVSDPKAEMLLDNDGDFYLNVQFHCHRYRVARTDTQSVLHYGLEKFLAPAAKEYLSDLKEALQDRGKMLSMLGEVEYNSDGDVEINETQYILQQLAAYATQYQNFNFHKIPYFFRMLVNMKLKSLRDLYAGNDRNSVRIPLPRKHFTRRYIAVWEDVIDETGLETPVESQLIAHGKCLMDNFEGDLVTWRQPNGYWRFNILHGLGSTMFGMIYGEELYTWLEKSPCIFVSAENQAQMLENWDGADFDDNVIVGFGPGIRAHFRELENIPFPATPEEMIKPDPASEGMKLPASFAFTWSDMIMILKPTLDNKGIGFYCNRWMTWNYYKRLALQNPEKFGFLVEGIRTPMQCLGAWSEVIIDSFAKFGGVGLGTFDKIVKEFQDQVQFISPFFYWEVKGELRSRLGAKTASRLLNTEGSRVHLPIDSAVADVKAMVVEFDQWASEFHRDLPSQWGLDPVFYAIDGYYKEGFDGKDEWLRKMYYSHFTIGATKEARKSQFEAANKWLRETLSNCTPTGCTAVLAACFRHVYNNDAKYDRLTNSWRFEGEDMLWESGALGTMMDIVIPNVLKNTPQFPKQMQFVVTFDWTRKLQTGELTEENLSKWQALGARNVSVDLKPAKNGIGVYLQTSNKGDILIGEISDRNALRAYLLNGEKLTANLAMRSQYSLLASAELA